MSETVESAVSLKNHGMLLIKQNRLVEAQEAIERFTDSFPNDAEGWQLLSTIYGKMGRIAEAEALARRAIELRPDYSEAHINLGHALLFQGKADEALAQYQKAIELKPDSPDAYLNIGNILTDRGRHAEAIDNYREALRITPDFVRAYNNLGSAYFELGRLDEALDSFGTALKLDPKGVVYLNNFAKACQTPTQYIRYLSHYRNATTGVADPREARIGLLGVIDKISQVAYEPWLDEELRMCYAMDNIDAKSLGKAVARILRQKHNGYPAGRNDHSVLPWALEHVAGNGLFVSYLEKSVNTDPDLEILLTKLRRNLVLNFQLEKDVGDREAELIRALAYQGANNEYVFAVTPEEQQHLAELRTAIEQSAATLTRPDPRTELNLSVVAMYDLLYSLSCREQLGQIPWDHWSENFRGLIENTLLHYLEEARIKNDIPTLGQPQDETSQSVQSQYEENPYPRWLSIPFTPKGHIKRSFKQIAPDFNPPAFLDGPLEILVAGCGTGKHPIQTALNYSNNIQITAIDISKSSLAYASRMARKLGVNNIRFMQADILDLAKLNKRFHIIESIGVLHHMQDPMAGWRVLNELLVDDGLMAIGLYSERARESVVSMRERIARSGLTPNKDDIRRFRSEILNDALHRQAPYINLTNSYDFFSTSGCRDLLFHVMEHRFTLPQINSALTELKLRFIGFKFSKSEDFTVKNQFGALFPDKGALTNLLAWDQFEKMYPTTFSNMYQFWCQKA